MSKGMIVLDIPEYCDYCPVGRIFGIESGVECLLAPIGHAVSGYGCHVDKPGWCPIRPLPAQYSIGMATTPILEEAWINRAQGITENQRR